MQLCLGWGACAKEVGAVGVGYSHRRTWLVCVLKLFQAPEAMGMTELMMACALRFVLSSDQSARLLIFVSQEQDSLDTGSPCPIFSL